MKSEFEFGGKEKRVTCDCHDPLVFGCNCRPRRTDAPASAVRVLSCAPPCRRQHEAPPSDADAAVRALRRRLLGLPAATAAGGNP